MTNTMQNTLTHRCATRVLQVGRHHAVACSAYDSDVTLDMALLIPNCHCVNLPSGQHWWSCPNGAGGQQEPFPQVPIYVRSPAVAS